MGPSPPPAKRLKTNDSDAVARPSNPSCGSWGSEAVIERVLFSREQIEARVSEMAAQVSKDFAGATEDSFVVIGLLAGCYMFMADFTRKLTIPHQVDFVAASSYGLGTTSSANVKIKKDLDSPIEGKHVLLLDEMCDTGRTMVCLKSLLQDRGAKSVKVCVLCDKAVRREVEIGLEYVGFTCPDEFVVGYGMDWSERFRSLGDICIVRKSAYTK